MSLDLPLVWAFIIAFAVLAYVILDGFDLGIGILFPLARDEAHRDAMSASVAPVWDGNETWLVLGGGGLMAVFPLAYAIIMPALYAPIILMLLGLIFRGVAFEFRWRSRSRNAWDAGFALGSTVATFAQGVALGALIQGVPVAHRAYAGGWWNWLSAFSLTTGVALVVGYGLLGATWLVMKTDGDLQRRMRGIALVFGAGTLTLIGVVSLWTPFLSPVFMERWFAWPARLYTLPVPLLVLAAAFLLWRGLRAGSERMPFFAALALFIFCFIGLGVSFYPWIVPPSVTIHDAAAPEKSLAFLLAGAIVLVPLILAYTAYSYWTFRGKVSADAGYH